MKVKAKVGWPTLTLPITRDAKDISRRQERVRVEHSQDTTSSNAMDEYEEAILFTFGALESRLKRLEYVLSGQAPKTAEKPLTIPDRIHKLEKSLQALNGKTSLLADAQELCKLRSNH